MAPDELETAAQAGAVRRARAAVAALQPGSVIGNAISLFGTTIVSSALGLAFWLVAAHSFSRDAIGAGGAAISAMQLLATVSMLGLGTLLIGEFSRGVRDPAGLLTTALAACTAVGVVAGGVFAVVAQTLLHADVVPAGVAGGVLFAVTVGISGALLVLDDAVIGLSRASWQFWRNLAFSVIKLAALPVVAAVGLGLDSAAGIVAAWCAGAALSILTVAWGSARARVRLVARPRRTHFGEYASTALLHHWLNVSSGAPRLVLPVFVAAYLSPAANSSFYTAVLLVSFAYVVPTHLSTALFGIASGDREALSHELRRTMGITALTALLSGVVFWAAGGPLLSVFGTGYSAAATPLGILGLATLATGIRSHYIAVCRVNGDLRRCALLACAGAAVELLLPLVVLACGGGLALASAAWVAGMWAEAVVFWPVVAVAGGFGGRVAILARWTGPRTLEAAAVTGA